MPWAGRAEMRYGAPPDSRELYDSGLAGRRKSGCRTSQRKNSSIGSTFFAQLQWELPRVNLHKDKPTTHAQLG